MAEPQSTSGGDATAAGAPPPVGALRRSKRESILKAEPTKVGASGEEETTQRRSQRSAKATPTKDPPGTNEPTMVVVAGETPSRRARPSRAATTTAEPPSTPIASPVLSPKKIDTPLGGDADALLSTPTRNRRPSRRQLEVDAPTQSAHLLLGQFNANDATALCEVVWYQIKENSHKPDVLLIDRSPACIDWHRVAERLAKSHDVTLTPRACQRLWKFLAYAQTTPVDGDGDDALLADSDPEDYELTADKINARVAAEADKVEANEPVAVQADSVQDTETDATVETSIERDVHMTSVSTDPIKATGEDATTTQSVDQSDTFASAVMMDESTEASSLDRSSATDTPQIPGLRETRRTAGVQLYPEYTQPSGIPETCLKPFEHKHSMPLVFVAEKFLKRKVVPPRDPSNGNRPNTSMEVDPSILAAAAMSVTLTGEKAQPKPKKKRVSDASAEEKKVKKPRKKKEPAASTAAVAKPAVGTASLTTLAAAMTKSPVPIRQAYVPSLTAPPSPVPARRALDFFRQLCKENPNIAQPSGGQASTDGVMAALPDATQLDQIFAAAPLHVRTACEQMANDDLRRFEREHLRRRLWEKARASLQNSPVPSPGTVSAPTSLPTTPSAPVAVTETTIPVPVPAPAVDEGMLVVPVASTSKAHEDATSSSVGTTSQIS